MNMMTSLENIPLKTSSTPTNDDSDDPLVKDILNEFNQEVNNQPPSSNTNYQQPPPPPTNDYIINNPNSCQIRPRQSQTPQKTSPIYNEDYIRKSAIIIIIVAFFFSPLIYNSIIEKLPQQLSILLTTYDFYFKLFLVFIVIYSFMIKNLL
jgi:hypothetical protein